MRNKTKLILKFAWALIGMIISVWTIFWLIYLQFMTGWGEFAIAVLASFGIYAFIIYTIITLIFWLMWRKK